MFSIKHNLYFILFQYKSRSNRSNLIADPSHSIGIAVWKTASTIKTMNNLRLFSTYTTLSLFRRISPKVDEYIDGFSLVFPDERNFANFNSVYLVKNTWNIYHQRIQTITVYLDILLILFVNQWQTSWINLYNNIAVNDDLKIIKGKNKKRISWWRKFCL